MTVAELIEQLKTFPPEALVIVQADAEGNGFDTLEEVGQGSWNPDDRWVYEEDDFDTEEFWNEHKNCVVLAP